MKKHTSESGDKPAPLTNAQKKATMEKLLGIFDNGSDSTVRGVCNDCGASLRYEYLTDGGVYGSECVHAHIHRPDWMTLKAKIDAQKWIGIQNTLTALENDYRCVDTIEYTEYRDGSISIRNYYSYFRADAIKMFIEGLIDSGWIKSNPESWLAGSYKYTLTRSEREQ